MTTMFNDHPVDDSINPDNLFNYDETSTSSNNTFFPNNLFDITLDQMQQRSSFSTSSDGQYMHPYLSRPPSLSPSSQSAQLLQLPHSPHSSASPRSVFSTSTSDDMLLNNSFSTTELDQFFAQEDLGATSKPNQSFYLPQNDFGTDFQHNFALFNMVNQDTTQPIQTQSAAITQTTLSPQSFNNVWGQKPPVSAMSVVAGENNGASSGRNVS